MTGIPESQVTQDWPKKWSVLKPAVVTTGGANATYATLNTWYTIRDNTPTLLQVDYTAPTDVVLLLALQFECSTDTAARHVEMCIMDDALTVITYGALYFDTAGAYRTLTILGARAFTAGETATIMGRIRLPAGFAQTVTMIADAAMTRLIYVPVVI